MKDFTPGPWICHSGMVWKPDGTPDGYPIARMDRQTEKTTPTERDANAQLIAAAPDLLAALRAIMNDCREVAEGREQVTPGFWHAILNGKARAAIAKAEGR